MPNNDTEKDDDEKGSIAVRAVAWLTKQKPETVMAFCVVGFMCYWLMYEHPETVKRSKAWHEAENIRTTDAIQKITETSAEANKIAAETQAKAVKEAAAIQAEAQVKAAKEHAEEVRNTTESYEKTLNRVTEIYDRNHLRDKKE